MRVDNIAQAARIGLSRPYREPIHLAKLLAERLVRDRSRLRHRDGVANSLVGRGLARAPDGRPPRRRRTVRMSMSASLVDTLGVRLGQNKVFRLAPVESALPERAMRRVPALHPPEGLNWPKNLPRPARLFVRPEKIEAVAELPDHPPRLFIWRKIAPSRRQSRWAGAHSRRMVDERRRDESRPRLLPRRDERTARATGCSATRRPSRAAAGGCTALVRHELRRTSGHDAFLVFARRVVGRGTVFGGGAPRHQGAGCCRPQFLGRHGARARSRQGDRRASRSSAAALIFNAARRCWCIRPTAQPMAGFAVC